MWSSIAPDADPAGPASGIFAAHLLILTGCRLNEVMTLKWTYVDLAQRLLRLPDSKTGAKIVHLGQPAVELLRTFASTAVASGQGLPMLGKLLGHTQVQIMARYAHLAAKPVQMAADAVAQNLKQSLEQTRAAASFSD